MKFIINWRATALFFMLINIVFVLSTVFFKHSDTKIDTVLQTYLKSQNDTLKKRQNVLKRALIKQKKDIAEKDSIILVLSNKKTKLKIIYYEKYNKIDTYSIRQLINEFDTVFAKSNIY